MYEISKLRLVGKAYGATTQEGTRIIEAGYLSLFFGGRRGMDLCATISAVVKHASVIIDELGHVLEKDELRAALRLAGRPAKTSKSGVCLCEAIIPKATKARILAPDIIVGCEECSDLTPVELPVDEPENRVVLTRPVDDHMEHVSRTRDVLRKRFADRIFRMNVKAGQSPGALVYVADIEAVAGVKYRDRYHSLMTLMRQLEFGRYKEDKDTHERHWLETSCPAGIVHHMLEEPDPKVPVLKALVRTPVISAEGEILSDTGYNSNSKVYLAPSIQMEPIPNEPTADDIAEAKALIDELLFDFPFAYPAAKGAAVASLVDQVVRSTLIEDPTPMYCFEAMTGGEGTGKSLLMQVISLLADGTASMLFWPGNDEELAKQIIPLVESQRSVLSWDNVDGEVKSAVLDSALTSRVLEGRRLGGNDARNMVRLPFLCSVFFSSNGMRVSAATARRMVKVQLDKKHERSERDPVSGDRIYLINKRYGHNIIHHVTNRHYRAQYIRAILLLTKAWILAGRPLDPEVRVLDSFERWSEVVPHIVRFGGWTSIQRAIEASQQSNQDRLEAHDFVCFWSECRGTGVENCLRAKALGELAIAGGYYVGAMKMSTLSPNPALVGRSINTRFMGYLKRWPVQLPAGQVVMVEDGPTENCQPTWYLRVIATDGSNLIEASDTPAETLESYVMQGDVEPETEESPHDAIGQAGDA